MNQRLENDAVGAGTCKPDQGLDVDALSSYLAQHIDGFRRVESLRRFEGGQSNPTYELVAAERTYVLRTKPGPTASLLPSAHAIEREYAVLQALTRTDVPVPRVYLMCIDESVIGRAFFLMDRVTGRILTDPSLPAMPNARTRTGVRRYESCYRRIAPRRRSRPRPSRLRAPRALR